MTRIAAIYTISAAAVATRTPRAAYHTAVWLLRQAANEPLNTVALRFGVSPSRISIIQPASEVTQFTPQQRQAIA